MIIPAPPNAYNTQTFKVKLDRDLAYTWISYTKDAQSASTYKRSVHVSSGRVYHGCFPINLEPIGENNTQVIATISFDHYTNLPEIIHVKEIFQ